MFNFVRNKWPTIAMKKYFLSIIFLFTLTFAMAEGGERVVVGAERLADYSHLVDGRRVGVLANHTSRVGSAHLVDTLLANGVDVTVIFAPSDGFRGDGKVVKGRDSHLGVAIKTLRSAPKANDIFTCDVILCDLGSAGVRGAELVALYSMMGVCADLNIPLVVLDRPLKSGRVVDGPILEARYYTSSEMLPLPLVYGMTLGEVARMINGEGWLTDGVKCPLTVVPCVGYDDEQKCVESVGLTARGLAVEVPIVNEMGEIDLSAVVEAYAARNAEEEFFVGEEFVRQIGASYIRDMVEQGYTAEEIEAMWRGDTERFSSLREQYLIYK